jgi:Tfp pilus assembly protein PilX
MAPRLRQRVTREEGIALLMALGIMLVLAISVTATISYTSSSVRSARLSASDLQSSQYAESGLNVAYSIVANQNAVSGGNPTAANLLGCNGVTGATDTNGPSDCSVPASKVVCFTAGCTARSAGSATVFGYFSGANPGTYSGIDVPASTWLFVSTGYAPNPNTGSLDARTAMGTVKITALSNGAVASTWNHMFITAPLVTNQCSVEFGGNGELITDPLYVIGNLCLTGQNVAIQEATGGQPIDLQVGGKLVLSGSGTKVGTSSTIPITSGVVVGGCTTVSVAAGALPCTATSYQYWVKTADTFVQNDAPERTSTQISADYAGFDPGPKNACALGGLPSTTFDNDGLQNGLNGSFELTPASSYTCVSQHGASVGQLSWNSTTKALTINGSVFLDGNVTISQAATYTGTAVIEANGTITINGNATTICAESPCDFTKWQGTSGNNSMLTLVALASGTTSIKFSNNSQTFQGSLWCQPSSALTFVKNGVTVEGPISCGKFDSTFNNASFKPLPVIKNMPAGAPVPPNTSAAISPLSIVR